MNCMVSIGHFAQPSIIALQARAIRATCGDIPILVSDDDSETAFDVSKGIGPERGAAIKRKLLDICNRAGLIYRRSGTERLGHAGGDLGAFYHGLVYARDHSIPWLAKLSQRYVIDIPNWLADHTRLMKKRKFNFNTGCRGCFYADKSVFHLRTECVIMEVEKWSRPDVLEMLKPRPLKFQAAEELVFHAIVKMNGGQCNTLSPNWLTKDRQQRFPKIAWKDTKPDDATLGDYQLSADTHGVKLGDDFNIAHSLSQPGFRWW